MDNTEREIIDEINQLLGDHEEYDPANPAITPAWDALRTNRQLPPPPAATVEIPASGEIPRHPVVGQRKGQLRQPSDHRNRQKMEWLLNPQTAKPKSRRPPAQAHPPRPTLEPARVMGPLPPPPIPVEVEPGLIVEVPHFAAHSAREWKTRLGGKRWHIRFNHGGSVRRIRELPPRP